MSQDPTTPISKAVEQEQDEVQGHRRFAATPEITDEAEEAEVQGHRRFAGAPDVNEDPEPEVEGHRALI